MRRSIRLSALTCVLFAAIALPASNAGAATTDPNSLAFGDQAAGTTGPTQSTTLTTGCTDLVVTCLSLPTDTMNVSVAATGDFVASTDCPASLAPSLLGDPASCTITVAFRPSGAGPRAGTLSTGSVGLLVPTAGPTLALSGQGMPSNKAGVSSANKCKRKKAKKHSASAAKKKKCKKAKKRK